MPRHELLGHVAPFATKEDGWVTPLSLYAFVVTAVIGGLGLDLSQIVAARTQLQVAADIAAHAALYNRDLLHGVDDDAAETSKARAIALARDSMPSDRFGAYITEGDIEFGWFDSDTRTFTPDPDSRQAARVVAFRVSERSNTVGSYLLRLAGVFEFDVVTSSIFETYRPSCFREGFVADGVVDVQSNNTYTNGFCIHSNQYVSVNQNNFFEPGTIVSMPNEDDIDLPASGFERNEGLADALQPGKYNMRILNRMESILDGMTDPESDYYRLSESANPEPRTVVRRNTMTPADFQTDRVNVIACGGRTVTLSSETFTDTVIIGENCTFRMSNGTALENMTLITTSTDDRSINAPNGFRLGADDDCADGGEAQIVTWGGVNVASGLQMFGSQIIAAGPIDFAANAEGIKGASMVSGETIDGTSNMSFGFCGTGMGNNFEADYFRMRA
jgi:hypothetical protein